MDVSTFLLEPGRAGYMVAIVGKGAPRFVHVADTSAAARRASITEAQRLLSMIGGGRALVLRLDAVVDQAPAELPPSSVNRCSPLAVEMSIDSVTKIGLKLASLDAEVAALRVAVNSAPTPAKPATLVVREHGIYKRRDGEIIKIIRPHFDTGGGAAWTDGVHTYRRDGSWAGDQAPNGYDLVREIVVGEGWKLWNGGIMVGGADERVDVVTRECVAGLSDVIRNCRAAIIRWSHEGKSDDILAYREVSAVAVDEPPFKPLDAVRVTETDGYVHDEIVSGCERVASGWRVTFVGGASIDASCVSLVARGA